MGAVPPPSLLCNPPPKATWHHLNEEMGLKTAMVFAGQIDAIKAQRGSWD